MITKIYNFIKTILGQLISGQDILQTASGLDRKSATEKGLCCLETSARGIFHLHKVVLSANFGSTGRLHYFSAVH